MENLEEMVFYSSENLKLYHAKQEFVTFVHSFPIHISAKGFFIVDRRFLAAVCIENVLIHKNYKYNFQISDGDDRLHVHHNVCSI